MKRPPRPPLKPTAGQAAFLAHALENAYSTDNYGGFWRSTVRALISRGYSLRETEALIRSKHTRWACDSCTRHRYGKHNSTCLINYIENSNLDLSPGSLEMEELVHGAFP
jgi:hypothetical protein